MPREEVNMPEFKIIKQYGCNKQTCVYCGKPISQKELKI